MHFHFCGDFVHDVAVNALVVLQVVADWLPISGLRGWVSNRLTAARSAEHREH